MSEPKANWSVAKEAYLVELLQHQAQLGKRADTGFKKEAWVAATADFNEKFHVTWKYTQLKTKFQQLKRSYTIIKKLKDQSGFGWDDVLQTVTADDHVWDAYVKVNSIENALNKLQYRQGLTVYLQEHEEAKPFQRQTFPLFEELDALLDGKLHYDNVLIVCNRTEMLCFLFFVGTLCRLNGYGKP